MSSETGAPDTLKAGSKKNGSSSAKGASAKRSTARGTTEVEAAATSEDNVATLASLSAQEVVQKFGKTPTDTGSPETQVALITRRLQVLSVHFKKNAQDRHSKRGMMRLISARKGLLQYLRETDVGRYRTLIGSLGLRK